MVGDATSNDISLLFVDDEPVILSYFSNFALKYGYKADTVASGKEALALLEETSYDVVITDVLMPGMSGIQLLKNLQKSFPDIPVIVVTSDPSIESATESLKLGAVDYVVKPIDPKKLDHTIRRALHQRTLEIENRNYRESLEKLVEVRTRELQREIADREILQNDYEALVENSLQAIVILQKKRVLFCNSMASEITGYSRKELNSLQLEDFFRIVHHDDVSRIVATVEAQCSRKQKRVDIEFRLKHKDGDFRHVMAAISKLQQRGSEALQVSFIDITRRKQIEEKLQESERQKELAIEGADLGTWDWDIRTSIVHFNDRWAMMLGYPLEEIEPHLDSWNKLLHPDDVSIAYEALNSHLYGQTPNYESEFRMRCKSGEWIWILDRGKVVERDESGRPVRACGTHQDITERKRSQENVERALKQTIKQKEELEALLDGAKSILENRDFPTIARSIFDAAKRSTGAASGYIALLREDGRENDVLFLESGGLPCTVDPDLPMPIRGLREQAYVSGETVAENDFENSEWKQYLPEGHVLLKNVLFAPLVIDGKPVGVMGLANKPDDFTPHDLRLAGAFGQLAAIALKSSLAIDALQKSEQLLHFAIDQAPIPVIIATSPNVRIEWINEHARALLVKPMPAPTTVPLDEHSEFWPTFHPDGTPYDVNELPLTQAVQEGKTTEGREILLRCDDGDHWLSASAAPLFDENGEIIAGIVTFPDVTEKKTLEEELRKFGQHLHEATEEVRKTIAREIHDEVGQAMTALKMDLNHFAEHLSDNIEQLQHIKTMMALINRTIESVKRLQMELRPNLLDDLGLEETLRWQGREFERRAKLECRFDIPQLEYEFSELESVTLFRLFQESLTNIMRHANAKKVEASLKKIEDEILLHVSDDGRGIPKETLTSASSYGLISMRERALALHGEVSIESRPGQGTKIEVRIPVTNREESHENRSCRR